MTHGTEFSIRTSHPCKILIILHTLIRGIDKKRITRDVNRLVAWRTRNSDVKTLGVDVIATSHTTYNMTDVNVYKRDSLMASPTLKSDAGDQSVCKKKNISWRFGADRKLRPSGSLFGITRHSLVMPNSDPRTDFSIRTSQALNIFILLHNPEKVVDLMCPNSVFSEKSPWPSGKAFASRADIGPHYRHFFSNSAVLFSLCVFFSNYLFIGISSDIVFKKLIQVVWECQCRVVHFSIS